MEPAQAWKDVLNAMRYNLDIFGPGKLKNPPLPVRYMGNDRYRYALPHNDRH
jgi:hypothetical protein